MKSARRQPVKNAALVIKSTIVRESIKEPAGKHIKRIVGLTR